METSRSIAEPIMLPTQNTVRFRLVEIEPGDAKAIENWLLDPSIHQWMDFGGGRQTLSAIAIMVLGRSRSHFVRLIKDSEGSPFAVVGLQHIDGQFKNSMLWYFRSDKTRKNGIKASEFTWAAVDHGFRTLGLQSIHAWVAENNVPSIALLKRLHFRETGRMRLAHRIDDVPCDRILFDITRAEFDEIKEIPS